MVIRELFVILLIIYKIPIISKGEAYEKEKLALLLVMGALLLNTTPCFAAAPRGEIMVKGSSGTEYTQLPTTETVLKDAGFSPKIPATLAGDFQFELGNITEAYSLDANGNAANERKGIH